MRFWQVRSALEPTDFGWGGVLPPPRRHRRPLAGTAAARGYVRLPGTGFGGLLLLWTSFVVPGPDGPSGPGLHIVF